MEESSIARINELYHKSKTVGLTEEEKKRTTKTKKKFYSSSSYEFTWSIK